MEITESAIMEQVETASSVLSKLKSLGVKLAMDDFGKGYSSLSYLHQFPFDTLKIDRSFIAGIGPAGENTEIVRTIISLAQVWGWTWSPKAWRRRASWSSSGTWDASSARAISSRGRLNALAATALLAEQPDRWRSLERSSRATSSRHLPQDLQSCAGFASSTAYEIRKWVSLRREHIARNYQDVVLDRLGHELAFRFPRAHAEMRKRPLPAGPARNRLIERPRPCHACGDTPRIWGLRSSSIATTPPYWAMLGAHTKLNC